MSRILSWFSCGAASAVATKLTLMEHGNRVTIAYCETGAEHPDNERFLNDCEGWFGAKVTRLKSDEYKDTWDVFERTRWLSGVNGARCTIELKVGPRLSFQKPDDIHVFGYTEDKTDVKRADTLRENYPEMTIWTPLIERKLTKESCLAIIGSSGIKTPVMYGLGFHNNNCLPCVKATSPNYWALMRREFPPQFQRMADLSRELGVRLCRINGERAFIDEIPADHPVTNPISPSCDFLCHLIESDLAEAA